MTRRSLLMGYQGAAGLCDAGTGVLLVAAPALTLRWMGVRTPPEPMAFASFVGVFVLAVGLTYLLVLGRWPLRPEHASAWRVQWMLTASVRTCVAFFLFAEIAAGRMEVAWLTVALTDGALAGVQWVGLRRNWLSDAAGGMDAAGGLDVTAGRIDAA